MEIKDLALDGIALEFPVWTLVDRRVHGPAGFPFGLHVMQPPDRSTPDRSTPDRSTSDLAIFTDEDLARTYRKRLGLDGLSPLRIAHRRALQRLVGYFLITGGEYVRIDPHPRAAAGRWTVYVGDFLAAFRATPA